MLCPAHHEAQELAGQAAVLLREGRAQEARELYGRAAALEAQAVGDIASDSVRTRGILTVSHVSLLYKAGQYEEAERQVFLSLGQGGFTGSFRRQLIELLEAVWDEKALAANGSSRNVAEIFVSMRGRSFGAGLVDPQDFSDQIRFVQDLVELAGGSRIKTKMRPIWSGDGSCRFAVRLIETVSNGSDPPVPLDGLTQLTLRTIRLLAAGRFEEFERTVPVAERRAAIVDRLRDFLSVRQERGIEGIELKVLTETGPEYALIGPELAGEIHQYTEESAARCGKSSRVPKKPRPRSATRPAGFAATLFSRHRD